MQYRHAPLAALLVATSCTQGDGLDGPRYRPLASGSGPCFEFTLLDGFEDGAEVQKAFDCLNRHGAFDPLAPLVTWLTTSDRVPPVVKALNTLLTDLDVPAAVDVTFKLLRDRERPLDGALALYSELYDDGLLPPLLSVGHVAAAHQDTCEATLTPGPGTCSAPRVLRALLKTDVLDRLGTVLDAIDRLPPTDSPPLLDTLADLLLSTSAAQNPGQGNTLLDLGRFLVHPRPDGVVPLDRILDEITPLLHDDALGDALAAELAKAERDGTLSGLADDARVLFTHDVHGADVGFDGTSIVDALLDVLARLDPALLTEPFTLPGSSEPMVLLDLALDTLDDLYRQQADIAAIVDELTDVTDLLCGSDASNDLCDLVRDLLPPITATVEQTTALPKLVLPLVHVLHSHTDVPRLLDLLNELLAWDLLGRAEPLLRWTVERDVLTDVLAVTPALFQPRLGRLSPAGADLMAAIRLLLDPRDIDGATVSPLDALLPVGRALLSPPTPDADLDPLLVAFATRLTDPTSALSADALTDLFDALARALPRHDIDLVALVTDLLDEEPLWKASLHVLAAPDLIALLRPDPRGGDTTWWMRDLIARGLVDRMLAWFGDLLGQLIDVGLLDPPPPPDAP